MALSTSSGGGSIQLPPLPPLPLSEEVQKSHGFTDKANWVIPNVLMQGGRPGLGLETESAVLNQVRGIVKDGGCNTFVSLQAECVPEKGSHFLSDGGVRKDIPKDLPGYAEHVWTVANEVGGPTPTFVDYGIVGDEPAKSIESLSNAVSALEKKIREGEIVYVHCGGGAGRAGLVAACLLGALYPDLDADAAMEYTTGFCQYRNIEGKEDYHCSSPETEGQRDQVREFFQMIRA